MGLWDDVRREVRRVVQGGGAAAPATTGSGTPEALRGPDPGTLLTAEEIEAATGNRPVGEGDRKSGGTETDVGFFRVCEWALTGGDELLVNTTRFRDEGARALGRSRNWNEEKPTDGVGEAATFRVNTMAGGRTELHVTAYQGMYGASLVHTSAAGVTDIAPLKELMARLLTRLD